MAFLLRLHYFLKIFYNNVVFFFFELTVSFSVDSPGGDDDVVLGAGLIEDSPVASSDTADSISVVLESLDLVNSINHDTTDKLLKPMKENNIVTTLLISQY